MEHPFLSGHSSVVGEGGGNAGVPQLLLSGYFFNLSVYGVGCRHNECSEVGGLEDGDVVIILFALVVVVASRQEVSFLVEDAGFVSKYEVVFG